MKTRIKEVLDSNTNNFFLHNMYYSPEVNHFLHFLHKDLEDLVVEERLKVLNLLEIKGIKISEENKKFILSA